MSKAAKKHVIEKAQQIKAYLSQPDLDQAMLNHIRILAHGIIYTAEHCKTYSKPKRQTAVGV